MKDNQRRAMFAKLQSRSGRVTISRLIQPADSRQLKEGSIFYRVKSDGELLNDFKTKRQAENFKEKYKKGLQVKML